MRTYGCWQRIFVVVGIMGKNYSEINTCWRAVILAAGRGSRMGHLGDDRPKCLVALEGKPLIERQIAALRRGGVEEIAVVRGYRAEMIDCPGLYYFANERWAETNYGDVARRGRSLAALGAGHRQLCRHLLPQRVDTG